MKKVTANGVDHELSPDSPRATSHAALLQNIVTSLNRVEAGNIPTNTVVTGTLQSTGVATVAGLVNSAGLSLTSFLDDSATAGTRTVNTTRGINKLASAGAPTTLTINNSLVTATSLVLAVLQTADATATIKNIVPGSGSFVITFGAAATADTKVAWVVIN
jgi:hypothetical protein